MNWLHIFFQWFAGLFLRDRPQAVWVPCFTASPRRVVARPGRLLLDPSRQYAAWLGGWMTILPMMSIGGAGLGAHRCARGDRLYARLAESSAARASREGFLSLALRNQSSARKPFRLANSCILAVSLMGMPR